MESLHEVFQKQCSRGMAPNEVVAECCFQKLVRFLGPSRMILKEDGVHSWPSELKLKNESRKITLSCWHASIHHVFDYLTTHVVTMMQFRRGQSRSVQAYAIFLVV